MGMRPTLDMFRLQVYKLQMAAPRGRATLCITERWIRERLNLQLDSLEDVRSLSLPGSYSEKITHLGRSLLGFTRLKHLDLSRNAIESLEVFVCLFRETHLKGLDYLKHLETLNLYYNNIATLKEVFRLRHNAKLRELDLRLNPITKNEPDYRLFLVHMLVNLKKLDDRSVRDSERKAALMHFDTDQAHEFDRGLHSKQDHSPPDSSSHHPHGMISEHIRSRKQLVHSLAPRPTALEDDTDELLELIAKNDGILSPDAKTRETIYQRSTGNFSSLHPSVTPSSNRKIRERDSFPELNRSSDHKPRFSDELEVYTECRLKGNFTPAPKTIRESSGVVSKRDSSTADLSTEEHSNPTDSCPTIETLLELLQEYIASDLTILKGDATFKRRLTDWLKSRVDDEQCHRLQDEIAGLQQHLQLKDSILQQREGPRDQAPLSMQDSELANLKLTLQQCESEAAVLGRQLQLQTEKLEQVKQGRPAQEEAQKLLEKANRDIVSQSTLRQHVEALQAENSSLQAAADQAPSTAQISKLQNEISQLESENQSLKMELKLALEKHQQDMQNSCQLQELAAMLQESHRSLIATNDHLLQELEDTKQRHAQEMIQMSFNYEQLRKSIDLMQHI